MYSHLCVNRFDCFIVGNASHTAFLTPSKARGWKPLSASRSNKLTELGLNAQSRVERIKAFRQWNTHSGIRRSFRSDSSALCAETRASHHAMSPLLYYLGL